MSGYLHANPLPTSSSRRDTHGTGWQIRAVRSLPEAGLPNRETPLALSSEEVKVHGSFRQGAGAGLRPPIWLVFHTQQKNSLVSKFCRFSPACRRLPTGGSLCG